MSTRFFTNLGEQTLFRKFKGVFESNPELEWFDALIGFLLLTHDLVWFEIAKEHTKDWAAWSYVRMFEEIAGPTDPTLPRFQRIKPEADDLDVARGYLYLGDLRAAGGLRASRLRGLPST